MNRKDLLLRLAAGIGADVADYNRLRGLLQEQFEAAVYHRSGAIAEVGEAIVALAGTLEARRQERVALAGRLSLEKGAEAMQRIFAMLPPNPRERLQASWQGLERLVRECKAMNQRNCNLLMEQQEIMQRVLNTEADIYVPR